MIVMKFGGTSVGGPEQIKAAARIVRDHRERRPVVVVSAITKVTDLLLATARAAGAGERETVRANLRRLSEIHREAIEGAIGNPEIRAEATRRVAELLAQLRRSLHRHRHARRTERPLARRRRRLWRALLGADRRRGAARPGAGGRGGRRRRVIVTDGHFGAATPLMDTTRERADATLRPLLDAGVVPVVTGFVGATAEGVTTTLGRGGSDYSASILGDALGATRSGSGPT